MSALPQISYKKFGISLNFTPVVMTEGRISLRVMTEVSELSNDNSFTLIQQAGNAPDDPVDQDPPRRKPPWKFRRAARWRWPA